MTDEKQKLESLELLDVDNSGLDAIFYQDEKKFRTIEFLRQFLLNENSELNEFLQTNPQLQDSIEIKAIFLLNLIYIKEQILPFHISVSKANDKVNDQLAFTMIEIYKAIYFDIELDNKDFYNFDFYQLKEILPTIAIYYSDFLLKDMFWHCGKNEKTKNQIITKLETVIFDEEVFDSMYEKELSAQKHRIRALFYRRKEEIEKAEDELTLYRKNFSPNLNQAVRLNKIYPRKSFLKTNLLENLTELYQEVSEIQEEALIRSGVYRDTCFYFNCSDCCKKDFPTVSLLEFLHIKNNTELTDELKSKAEKILGDYHTKYNKDLKIVDQKASSNQDENPENFQFACPFLDEKDSCSVHQHRPLACRSFGLSTIDDSAVQACNFYLRQYQFNSSHRNERDVYDSRQHTALIGAANNYLSKNNGMEDFRQPVAVLPVWVLGGHCEERSDEAIQAN